MELIIPNWPVAPHIKSAATTRAGGYSSGVYEGLNLGDHVGDSSQQVEANRDQLLEHLSIEQAQWLNQVHGTQCIEANALGVPHADACYTDQPQLACIVMTADCLPVLLTDGQRVGAAHAGWRGLANGILEATLQHFDTANTYAWLGPAIGPQMFEVGEDVRDCFCQHFPESVHSFLPGKVAGKWLADIYSLAKIRLHHAGVAHIYGGGWCTYSDPARFFSYRRDQVTGRMATLIWKTA